MRLVFLCVALAACSKSTTETDDTDVAFTPTAVPVDQLVAGKSYGEWGGIWWKSMDELALADSPIRDATGANCANGQTGGDVWFLAGHFAGEGPVTRSCTVPADKYLLVPLFNYIDDWPCPDPTFGPTGDQTLEEFLIADAASVIDHGTSAKLDVDGTVIDGMDHRAHSGIFDFTGGADQQTLDACITYTVQQGLADGYWLILEPLPAGSHTLHATAESTFAEGFSEDYTYNLTVE